ncbi:hypothetical protein ABT213_06085 [Streptomyces sp. NPDC001674]|uniref:hypothetical protein n=1 Tax=Streptomyces sp. NPDC001674 TaxID=3154394 RepID=UPI003328E4B9
MDDPCIFTSSSNPRSPALLRYPEGADPGLIISKFKPGFFDWSTIHDCPTFDSGKRTEVVTALFEAGFSHVQLKEGKSENELSYENRVKRPAHIRPREISHP